MIISKNGLDIIKEFESLKFANEMWLGEIMITIVAFYFGGGLVESYKKKRGLNE